MAGGALYFALQKVDSLLAQEQQLLVGLNIRIKDIRDDLENLNEVLRENDADEDNDEQKAWKRQLREVAYDIEDLLDEYMIHFGQARRQHCLGFMSRSIKNLTHLYTKHRMSIAIQDMKARVKKISENRNMYSGRLNPRASIVGAHSQHLAAMYMEESELVGISGSREVIIRWLREGETELKVISVVGMAGLGKTTLVRKVYDDETIKGWFKSHAWIIVTQSVTIDELLKRIIIQFYDEIYEKRPSSIETMDSIQLIETLQQFLQDKRYIIVLDNLWNISEWDDLKCAFPKNHCGSRILVTTRNRDVGASCLEGSGHIYDLQPLDSPNASLLFCRRAFRSLPGATCPPQFQKLVQDIVSVCEGLPLAIVTVAGLLSKKNRVDEWISVCENLHDGLANNHPLKPITRLLLLSYNDLPHYLRSCLLYFSIFPKEYSVTRITLIRLWIAEGFIESERGETMERVASDYLNELIDRSLVKVAECYDYGRVQSCRVHGLVHDLIVRKSRENNFSTFLIGQDVNRAVRRLSLRKIDEDLPESVDISHTRALFVFGGSALPVSSMLNLFSRLKVLRILDLHGAPIESFPVEFGKLPHLRYLSFRNTRMRKLSKSLGQLKNLETLDLKGTYITELPKSILKLQKLRHLLAYQYYSSDHPPYYLVNGVKLPQGIGRFRELQKLTYLETNENSSIVKELENLTQLKRLGIVKLRTEDGANLCASIERMEKLQSLSVTSTGMDELLDLNTLTTAPAVLQRLYLRGPLQTLPSWISPLKYLVRMRLRWSQLEENSLPILEALPSLVELALIHAYDGANLVCHKGGFPKLEILTLELLNNLNSVTVNGSMANLQKLYIISCTQLQKLPLGIKQLKHLKEIHLFDMPQAFVQKLRGPQGEDHREVSHVPIRRSYDTTNRVYEEL